MRLIDADAFLGASIQEKRFVYATQDAINDQMIIKTVYHDLFEALAAAPTIDAEPVVRCKDCACSAVDAFVKRRFCTRFGEVRPNGAVWGGVGVCDDHFCSYGKRKTAEVQDE